MRGSRLTHGAGSVVVGRVAVLVLTMSVLAMMLGVALDPSWGTEGVSPPVFQGSATASPNPAIVGQPVAFAATVTSPDGLSLTVVWDFGDGASAGTAMASHAYTAPGTYAATVTADDGKADPVSRNVPVLVAHSLTPSRLVVRLNFKKTGKDVVTMKGTLAIPEGFETADQPFSVDVGGAVVTGILNAKGKSPALLVKSTGIFKVVMKGAFAASLTDDGLTDRTVKDEVVTVPVLITVGADVFGALRDGQYTANQGKRGKVK